ncbi:MAG: xanthine dehydrogenase family protein molybdopterin-binding subunit [Anaerolineaceae bacterium]|nr:xanthine dehydrogenase family protein molybdopterin-binding subunit [Anaerolineaceae bacterium]
MAGKYLGQRLKRNEDPRLLTGQALFVDDVELPGMLHAAFLRSDYPHARINSIDTSAAKAHPGVVAVYTPTDMGAVWKPGPLNVPPPSGIPGVTFNKRTQVPMAKDYVHHQGEALAMVVAESRYVAEDALADIIVDLEPLDVVIDLEQALEPGSPLVHEDLDTNLASHVQQENGNYAEAAAKADVVIQARFIMDRGTAAALENRGYVASWDPKNQSMTMWATTQGPIALRNGLATILGLSEHQIRVIAPFVGGGFGPKILLYQPEEILVSWASLQLGKPVKWIEDRQENFLATTQERLQIHDSEIALTKEGKIVGVKDAFLHDTGAYNSYALTIPLNTQTHTTGPYKVPNYYTEYTVVFTNRIMCTPLRGAGRTYGTFVMERLMDLAAKKLGMDRLELRRKNLIQPEDFPYKTGIVGQDFAKNILDSGNFPATLDKCLQMVDYEKFITEEQPKLRKAGRHVGIGVAMFTEGSGVGPYEGARVTVEASGKVAVATGVGTQGQGHFTSFAQIVAEQIGVDPQNIFVTTGDTEVFHWGAGTFASRGATVAGSAINAAALLVRGKILKLASKILETPEEELELVDGTVRVADIPSMCISLGELATKANPSRGAVEPGSEPGLEATAYYGPPYGATGGGTCAMIVEVDTDTFNVKILRYVIAHDCGTVLNALILDGQVHGGIELGIGNSFFEKLVVDKNGQLQNGSFADYLIPRATDMPTLEVGHLSTPSPLNPLGIKGVGEAGAIPTPPAFIRAVEDALYDLDLTICEAPLSPNRLFELVQQAKNE